MLVMPACVVDASRSQILGVWRGGYVEDGQAVYLRQGFAKLSNFAIIQIRFGRNRRPSPVATSGTEGDAMSTQEDSVKALGLDGYDWAMPQPWFEMACKFGGFNPCGHIVWCYDTAPGYDLGRLGGYPVALDMKGRQILGAMAIRAQLTA